MSAIDFEHDPHPHTEKRKLKAPPTVADERVGFNGRLEGAQTTMITARILVASALLAGVSWGVWKALHSVLGGSLAAQILSVGAAAFLGSLVYVRAVLAMRVPEAHQVMRLVRGQLGRA